MELDEKWRPQLTESLKNIEIDGWLRKMNWKEQIEYLVPSWIEKVTKLAPSWAKKVTKFEKSYYFDIQDNNNNDRPSPNEKVTKLAPSLYEKSTKLPSKKLWYIITILMMSGIPVTIDDLIEIFSFRHKTFFRENYLKPLESVDFITKTNPDKPTASNQKYLITEKGKRFLTGQDF
jgi:predicted transcriptional regulator